VEKVAKTFLQLPRCKKLPKVKNRPIGENSPNRVTLAATNFSPGATHLAGFNSILAAERRFSPHGEFLSL
jgi:hypothetical protein